jgi:hypothetical protein
MAKPKKPGARVKMSQLTIARIEVKLLALAAALKPRVPDLTPAKLRASRSAGGVRWGSSNDRRSHVHAPAAGEAGGVPEAMSALPLRRIRA